MAQSVCHYSDIIVLTSDNPRSENPQVILDEMKGGISKESWMKKEIFEILDRRQAIEKLIAVAEPGDVLFILGKGHEGFQYLGEKKVPFDDREVAKECLKRKSRVFLS